jgi:hypothetical protein
MLVVGTAAELRADVCVKATNKVVKGKVVTSLSNAKRVKFRRLPGLKGRMDSVESTAMVRGVQRPSPRTKLWQIR